MSTLLFIVGTGRSGTHSLTDLFAGVPNTVALHEGNGTDVAGAPVKLGDLMGLNVYLAQGRAREAAFRDSRVPQGWAGRLMHACFERRRRLIEDLVGKGENFCDVNRLGYNYINYIHAEYPQAKFIHVVRDGYNCVRSWSLRAGAYPARADWFKHKCRSTWCRYFGGERHGDGLGEHLCDMRLRLLLAAPAPGDRLISLLADMADRNYHLEKPVPYHDDLHYQAWSSYSRLEKLAWFWQRVNRVITEHLEKIPDAQKRTLRIEDLDQEKTGELLAFAEMPARFEVSPFQPSNRSRRPSSYTWSPAERARFNAIAGVEMERWGYALS